jgi:ABC-type multidrug transport system permease subunit
LRSLLVLIGKDLRLLWRDKAGLIFLTIAPIVVITVAGFSLANLYGADPTGQTAYDFPLADEDGGAMGGEIRARLGSEASVRMRVVGGRAEAEELVRSKRAGSALVIPAGTEAALEKGEPASLVLYIDSVKYLERLNVRSRLLELRDEMLNQRRQRWSLRATGEVDRLRAELDRLRARVEALRDELTASWNAARAEQEDALIRARERLQNARSDAARQLAREVETAGAELRQAMEAQLREWQRPLRLYVDTLQRSRNELERWLADLKQMAGRRAGTIPAPPPFPEPPAELIRLLEGDLALRLPTPRPPAITFPAPSRFDLPPLPPPPPIELPEIELPPAPRVPGQLAIKEVDVGGGTGSINTFDQNVPGFSVTFLLLGMLLGVSLGLLDERDWGTLERLRGMPVSLANVLMAKLCARFAVGFVQMVVLLAIGWLAFGVSLGSQPPALLLPIAGIVFAGVTFGLIVAAVAPSREAVLPVGSIVIVTMAAIGGCWWPIDLEPRWMRTVALAFPTTWAMDAFNDLMIRRRPGHVALMPTGVLFAYGLLYLMMGLALFRRRTARW